MPPRTTHSAGVQTYARWTAASAGGPSHWIDLERSWAGVAAGASRRVGNAVDEISRADLTCCGGVGLHGGDFAHLHHQTEALHGPRRKGDVDDRASFNFPVRLAFG